MSEELTDIQQIAKTLNHIRARSMSYIHRHANIIMNWHTLHRLELATHPRRTLRKVQEVGIEELRKKTFKDLDEPDFYVRNHQSTKHEGWNDAIAHIAANYPNGVIIKGGE